MVLKYQPNYVSVSVSINLKAACFSQSLVIIRPALHMKIKLEFRIYFELRTRLFIYSKGKIIPVLAWTRTEGFSRLRPKILRQSGREGGKVVIPTHRPPLLPRKYSWYSFLLEVESTPGT